MWKRCSEGQSWSNNCSNPAQSYTWQQALQVVKSHNDAGGFAGQTDWRLPNVKELSSIIEERCYEPSINNSLFPGTSASGFWSASAYAGYSDTAWYVLFSNGDAGYHGKNGAWQVRLVRAGQSFDFLAFNLNIAKLGTGSGTVISNPAGIDCGTDCNEDYANGTNVTLTATPAAGSSFAGWSGGGCSGTASTCVVTVNAATTVTATFNPALYSLNVVKSGNGTVISTPLGINCGTDCSENYTPGASVTLKATPSTGSIFTKWSGGCTGTSTSCVVTMNADKTTTASFLARPSVPVIAGVAGNAQVTLNWAAVAGAASYKVFQGMTAGGESTTPVKTGVTGTSVVITGLSNGSKYFFKMAAVNAAGTSALSNEVGATPRGASPKPDFVVANLSWKPANPGANGFFDVDVTIKNQGTTGAEGGYLDIWANQATAQGCGAEGDAWTSIGNLAAGASRTVTLTLKVPTGGTRTLRAFVDSWCETVESNEANNQFTRTYVVTPAAPTISAVVGNGQVTLKWTAVTGATSYKVFQGLTAGGESMIPVKTSVTGTSVVITGLTNGTAYFFTLAAVNAGGTSAWSNEVSATPAP
ncbi:conserved hypothetical protein [Gammaproteobacteria bacterium]